MIVHHSWQPIIEAQRTNFNHCIINDFNHVLSNDLNTDEAYVLMTNLIPWFRLGQGVNPFEIELGHLIGYRIEERNLGAVHEMLRINGYTLGSENRIRAILGITCTTILIRNPATDVFRFEINILCDTFPP